MRKCIATMMMAVLLVIPAHGAAAEGGRYSDVPEGHWAAEGIERAAELGLFMGTGDGKFGLGQPTSRAAFATALARLFGWETSGGKKTYADVPADSWYYGAVEAAAAHGAVAADVREFRPMDNITREEMASMIVRGLGYTSLAGAASEYPSPFSDVSTNKGFITVAYDLDIAGGIGGGRFDPDGTAAREQAAVMLVRVYDKLYAKSVRLLDGGSYTRVTVDTPEPAGGELPTTPLEPLTELYDALRKLKNSGADMGKAAVVLTAGGVRTVVGEGGASRRDTLSAAQVQELLEQDGVSAYYSQRYESAYCIYVTADRQTATVWYQSPESKEVKLQLARLFGVTRYILN